MTMKGWLNRKLFVEEENPKREQEIPNDLGLRDYDQYPPMPEPPPAEEMYDEFVQPAPIIESEAEFIDRMQYQNIPPNDYFPDDEDAPPEEDRAQYYEEDYGDFSDYPETVIPYEELYNDTPIARNTSSPSPTPSPIPSSPVPPAKTIKDDEILIEPEMLTGRRSYVIKEDYLDELIDKIFSRLDIPAIEYKAKLDDVKEVIVETGGGLPANLAIITGKDGVVDVPLGNHEQKKLDDTVEIVDKNVDKEM